MSTLKVDTIDTSNSSGNITVSRPLSGSGASLTALNASNLATGTVATARLGTGTANNGVFLRGDGTWDTAGSTSASDLTSGTLPMARLSGTLPALNGSALTALNATQLTSGTIPIARLGNDVIDSQHYAAASIDNEHLADDAVGVAELSATGTANNTTFLRGDNAWAAAGGGSCTLISVQDVDAAEVDFEPTANSYALADYTAFLFIFTTVWSDSASAATLYMRVGYNDGTYHTGGYGRAMHAVDHDAAEALEGAPGSAGQWQLMDVSQDNNDGVHNYAYQATLWVPSYAAATTRSFQMRASGAYGDDGGDDLRMVHCVGNIHNASSSSGYDSFRFFYSSGNVNGRISMYGYKDS